MLSAPQLARYFPDLTDERLASALALVHSRFSTNTFPSWELAHPYRVVAHNGEINTLRGNVNWIRARESQLASELFGDDLDKVLPVIRPGGSDTAMFDNVLELLTLAGRSLPHALMMMVPEAYAGRDVSEDLRGFYRFHECLTEAWDGPAAMAFTDGTVIGATLDRNGLRPGRWLETEDGWVVLASEAGVLDIPASQVVRKGRLQPGRLFLVDLAQHRIVPDEEAKAEVAGRKPYGAWFDGEHVRLADLPAARPRPLGQPLRRLQLAFGYTQEDMKVMLAPLAANAEEAVGSMGNDTPLAVLSDRRPLLYSYFKQLFAQVTNPPIDPIREAVVMSKQSLVGSERNLLDETPEHARQLVIDNPILRDEELERLRAVDSDVFRARTIDFTWPVTDGAAGIEDALERICVDADDALAAGVNVLVLSDRGAGPERVAMPSLLAVSAIHHHLVRAGTRLQAGLVVESGEPRSVQSVAVLIGYGAAAVNPYVMLATVRDLVAGDDAEERAIAAVSKGLLKTISKMGISTLSSYCGAQVFEAVGLSPSSSTATSPAPRRASAASVSPSLQKERSCVTRGPIPSGRTSSSPWWGCTPGAATASTISGTPRRSRSCSTPSAAAAGRPTRSSRRQSTPTPRAARPCAACFASGSRSRSRSTTSSRRPRSSSGSRRGRCRSARSRARRTRRSRRP